jgi:hypothetical protein
MAKTQPQADVRPQQGGTNASSSSSGGGGGVEPVIHNNNNNNKSETSPTAGRAAKGSSARKKLMLWLVVQSCTYCSIFLADRPISIRNVCADCVARFISTQYTKTGKSIPNNQKINKCP